MAVCYDKLWKLMIDKKINKTQLCEKAKITTNAMAKLGRNEDVRVETLAKICNVLNCTMDDIMELNKTEDGGNSK
ncbi:MAG: helix-turn-helix transcriptional regulator [Eubacteriales bacterium]|nr:helix-turn-helix transcriptional regulator [Eubacteriales bacterium]